MSAVGRCDLGRVRSQNEDSIYISENPNTEFEYFIVAAAWEAIMRVKLPVSQQ